MHFIRGILRWFSSGLFHASIILLLFSLSIVLLFGNKDVTKQILDESRVYEQFIPALIADNQAAQEQKSGILPFDDPMILEIANESFSQDKLRRHTEYILDQLHLWLDGSSDDFLFSVSLREEADLFIEGVSTYAAQRLTDLPSCGGRDISQTTVFELDCRPEQVSLEFVRDKIRSDLQSAEVFSDTEFTQEDLPRNRQGEQLVDQLQFVPPIVTAAKQFVWLYGLLVVGSAAFFVAMRRPVRKGFRALGRDVLTSGVTFMVMTLVFGFILPSLTNTLNVQGSETVQLLNNVTDAFVRLFDILVINLAVYLVAVAVLIIAIEKISRPSGGFGAVAKKAGVVSSIGAKMGNANSARSKDAPIQTSESKSVKQSRTRKPRKYRKMGL